MTGRSLRDTVAFTLCWLLPVRGDDALDRRRGGVIIPASAMGAVVVERVAAVGGVSFLAVATRGFIFPLLC